MAPTRHGPDDLDRLDPAGALSRRLPLLRAEPPFCDAATLMRSGLPSPPARVACLSYATEGDAATLAAAGFEVQVVARRPRLDRRPGIVQSAGSIDRLPVPDAWADALWSNMALHRSVRIADAFREAARVLRPGGVLLATWMDAKGYDCSDPDAGRILRTWATTPGFAAARPLTSDGVMRAAVAAGFDVQRCVPTPHRLHGSYALAYAYPFAADRDLDRLSARAGSGSAALAERFGQALANGTGWVSIRLVTLTATT